MKRKNYETTSKALNLKGIRLMGEKVEKENGSLLGPVKKGARADAFKMRYPKYGLMKTK